MYSKVIPRKDQMADHHHPIGIGNATRLIFALMVSAAAAAQAEAAIPASEKQVLVNIYNETNGPAWGGVVDGWPNGGNDVCTLPWSGITCDEGGTHVTEIDLGFRFLSGTLPDLSALSALQVFHVNDNSLTGSIPPIASLTNLQTFDVVGNYLSGPIPALNGMTQLVAFYANENLLTGAIPALTNLPNLHIIYVNDNQLTGQIPALTGVPSLEIVEVGGNKLTGVIPTLSGLSNLSVFEANGNLLSGPIGSFNNLPQLYLFNVDDNQLSGSIPSLAALTGLLIFDVGHNQLVGPSPVAPFPSQLTDGDSVLCPNALTPVMSAVWDSATGNTPWYSACDPIFGGNFET